MKIINKYLLLFAAALGVYSCNSDYEAPNDLTDIMWHIGASSYGDYTGYDDPYIIGVNDYIAFMDLSQGCVSHEWQVSTNGTYFITDSNVPLNIADDEVDLYKDYSISHNNSLKSIVVLFTEEGEHTVRLYNKFEKEALYDYVPDTSSDYVAQIPTVKIGDYYVFDKTFYVNVYGTTLEPASEVFYDAEMTLPVTTSSVYVDQGSSLYVKDATKYYASTTGWSVEGQGAFSGQTIFEITPSSIMTGEIVFNQASSSLGSFYEAYHISQTSERAADGTGSCPSAEAVTAYVDLNVYVVPSTDPLTIKSILPRSDEYVYDATNTGVTTSGTVDPDGIDESQQCSSISIILNNGPFDATTLAGNADKFTVAYKNVSGSYSEASPAEGTVTVTSLSLTPENENELILTLSAPVYNTDNLTINYDSTMGTLAATGATAENGRMFELETDYAVKPSFVDLFDVDGFDLETLWNNKADISDYFYLYPVGEYGNKVSLAKFDGEVCLKYEKVAAVNQSVNTAFPIELPISGKYNLYANTWIDSSTYSVNGSTAASVWINFRIAESGGYTTSDYYLDNSYWYGTTATTDIGRYVLSTTSTAYCDQWIGEEQGDSYWKSAKDLNSVANEFVAYSDAHIQFTVSTLISGTMYFTDLRLTNEQPRP